MQIITVNDAAAQADPSLLADEQAAINIYNATFTNNITLTLNFSLGSFDNQPIGPEFGGFGNVNFDAAVFTTYSQLRTALRTSGQPGFFNDANLPAGDSLNGVSNFWVSSSEAKALGLPLQDPSLADGSVGINTTVTPGAARIQVFLHEIGHAMGRVPDDLVFTDGVTSFSAFSALDLVRFVRAEPPVHRQGPNPRDGGIFFGRRRHKESSGLGH